MLISVLALFAVGFVIVLGIGYFVSVYNSLIRVKHNIEKAWKNIDVLLKQRRDELVKLMDTVKAHMRYEQNLLRELTKARTSYESAGTVAQKAEADRLMTRAFRSLFAVAENYPQISASQSFGHLEKRISELEDQISDRREFYNDSVYTYNMRIEQIPYSFIASMLGYHRKEYFKVEEEEKADVKIEL